MAQRQRRWRKVKKEQNSDREIKKQRRKRNWGCRGIEEGEGRGREINGHRLKDSKRKRDVRRREIDR